MKEDKKPEDFTPRESNWKVLFEGLWEIIKWLAVILIAGGAGVLLTKNPVVGYIAGIVAGYIYYKFVWNN